MKTKPIPIIITLTAAFIVCIISALQRADFSTYTKRLIITVILFAIIGTIVRVVIEKTFPIMEEGNEESEDEESEDSEDTVDDDELHREDEDDDDDDYDEDEDE